MNSDYQIRIVTDDEQQDQIGEAIPVYVPWRMTEAARRDELLTTAACVLQGHVQASQNNLRCIIERWKVGEPEFHDGFTAQSTSWAFVATTAVTVRGLGEDGIAWDT